MVLTQRSLAALILALGLLPTQTAALDYRNRSGW
jgi:hypothetical protein